LSDDFLAATCVDVTPAVSTKQDNIRP